MPNYLAPSDVRAFQKTVYTIYKQHGRPSLPWRHTTNPYFILVSEIMLQQTQAERVIPKYKLFIKTFPSFHSLAKAPLKKVLRVWQGLGYNRRALALKKIAERITESYGGTVPKTPEALEALPGIGYYTARAILAFAFNQPHTFIETNIRTVFIHHFFTNTSRVADKTLFSLIERTLDRRNPRVWYWALMDYGAMLKTAGGYKYNTRSNAYRRQSTFKGSNRELRGKILRALLKKNYTIAKLSKITGAPRAAVTKNIAQLSKENLVKFAGNKATTG